jgi:pimeloyl-ACP methyl ester carboxylesterase
MRGDKNNNMALRGKNHKAVFNSAQVTSVDNTVIGYRQTGSGPVLVVVHGGGRASHHYRQLAEALADTYTVYLPDRRGRGLSGSAGDNYSIIRECEDLATLLNKTGAQFVFGHSSGGLIALEAALKLPVRKLAVYEPAVSINGSIPTAWLPAFEQALAKHNSVAAMVVFLKGLRLSPASWLPSWVLTPLMYLLLRGAEGREMIELLPTLTLDMALVKHLDSGLERYKDIAAETLLLGGDQSPAYLRDALSALSRTLPHAKRIELPRLGHNAPDNDAPERIAGELRQFFQGNPQGG